MDQETHIKEVKKSLENTQNLLSSLFGVEMEIVSFDEAEREQNGKTKSGD